MNAISLGPVGHFYLKYPHEEKLGPVFIRQLVNNYHVCVQDTKRKDLYQIVADVTDLALAEKIKHMIE